MDLILSVVADPEGANMIKHTKLFSSAGGSFGRADSNDWVLPDPQRVVSSRHGEIQFANNQFYLIDQSTNGTYHNQSEDPLGKGNRVALTDGDAIVLGDYRLKVSIRQARAEAGLPDGLGGADFLDSVDRTTFSPAAAAKMQTAQEAKQLDSWLDPTAGNAGGNMGAGGGASSNPSGEWGYLTGAPCGESMDGFLGQEAPSDPLEMLNVPGAGIVPPVASADHWGGDDDWWKEGSAADHAPVHSHAMQFSVQQSGQSALQSPPLAPPQPNSMTGSAQHQSFGTVAETPQPSVTPAPTTNNPFADSLSALVSEQVQGAPGFDTPAAPESELLVAPAVAPSTDAPVTPSTAAGFAGASQQFAPVPTPSQSAQPQPQGSIQGNMLAERLGLNLRAEQLQHLDQQSAEIIEETVSRLIDLLRARTSIKNELRVQRTMIQTEANNPLKFSASAADALAAMFAGNGAFLQPVDAVRDSFDDLSDHQVAVLSGMRAGYDAMLRFFSPEYIERRNGAQGGVFSSKGARNWDNFVEMYRQLISDPEACYRRLFGDEFAATYESQLSELKNARSFGKGQ
ncbi:type VI secretion system-associated FHA domain protein TagH [Microbulbifer salipaludis]|uniref:Type VI secretion system-associated FHA domain protein TagH n=1 Tax=Microbulbifer salipaludis TaxID=187980 RepID=A0ABS3E3L5_9GAMM|nr:type VI secretion system-associated FHA domain protein TagH [Microbulbifer salipaludis]MBN8429886.1 type VI secretion system-associated FHA domain protein TagH [Microbulbifer salipaludis]